MNDYEAKQCHEAMLKFLTRQANDKIKGIEASAKEDFNRQKEDFIKEEQERIVNDFKNRLE